MKKKGNYALAFRKTMCNFRLLTYIVSMASIVIDNILTHLIINLRQRLKYIYKYIHESEYGGTI